MNTVGEETVLRTILVSILKHQIMHYTLYINLGGNSGVN
jgi:predicted SprT family Zn-dependent metalloprotease